MRATIVGGGVSGLTTAVTLLEAGWNTHLIAREPYPDTVSVVAAAVWTMTSTQPAAAARRYALTSRARFEQLSTDPRTGVHRLRQRELERDDPGPTWWETTPHVRRISIAELPDGYAAGFEVDGFIIDPPTYLRWLTRRMTELGGTSERAEVGDLDDVAGELVVNCTGLGSVELVGDTQLVPIRGQVVAIDNPGIRDAVADESDPDRIAYVYPRPDELVLGGCRQQGNDDTAPDPELTRRILDDAARLDPRVIPRPPRDIRVGLRPGRPTVRVEREERPDGRALVHNYGHGGAGYILSWGCAGHVAGLADPASR